ncbi:MAG: HAD-IC family P-type ATPase [Clostridium sp.]|uniref:heavy metal translocating P-type ATPase n=1 Tax=Clostridium sp. TaxID=1506 RepID=UPI0039EA83C5
MNAKKRELILEGLCCANCAAKIENKSKNILGVSSANIDFVSKKLTLEIENENEIIRILEEAKSIVKKIEPDVKIIDTSITNINTEADEEDNFSKKIKFVALAVGIILYIVTFFLADSSNVKIIFSIAAYLLIGAEVLIKSFKNIIRGEVFDENFLMSIASIGALAIKQYPEGIAVMLFYQIGETFQDMAVDRSRRSITKLMDIKPEFANLQVNDDFKKVHPEDVNIGDIILIKPGEKVPLDGTIIKGASMVDTSDLTGESLPREVNVGSTVLGGFINNNGVLTVKVTKGFGESAVSKILELVQNASSKKAQTENFITKFARYYTPIVTLSAVLLAVVPTFVIPGTHFSQWLYRALVFLVVSCPCALVISIPLGFFGGIGGASRKGILIKGSNYLEALYNVKTVVFDKTGTLTKGVFTVTEVNSRNNITEDELLKYAALAESYSNHPIAKSILKAYEDKNGKLEKVHNNDIPACKMRAKCQNIIPNTINLKKSNNSSTDKISKAIFKPCKHKNSTNRDTLKYSELAGYGIKAIIKGKNILAGNAKLMKNENIAYEDVNAIGTIIHIAIDNVYAGYIVISDELKNDSASAIKALKNLGMKKTVMLTGDTSSVAAEIGNRLGIDKVYSELLPNEKVEKFEMLYSMKTPKEKILYVGDGVNDAPVLARADVGVAMGGLGSDAAIEASDVVIMTDEPSKIVTAIKVARKTQYIVWQNIIFALGIKVVILVLGALGFANMWEAVFGDVGVALIAVLNSMRALNVKKL